MGTVPGRKSLLFAVVLPLLAVMDLFTVSTITPGAMAVRLAWSVELVAFAVLMERASEGQRRLLYLLNGAFGSLCYMGIVHFTGALASPYVNLVPTLPLVVAFIYPEEMGSAIASGLACGLGIVVLLLTWGGSTSQAVAWASMVGTATFFGVYGSSQFRKATLAQNEVRVERARREAAENLARAEHRRAQSEKLATVGRLAANVMHEINNPLAFVRSNVNFIQNEVFSRSVLDPQLREELEEVFNETRSGMDRIQQIIMDLKGFSRSMDAEEACEVALVSVVEDAARLASVRLKSVGKLKVEVPSDLPEVFVTPRRLAQVLLNLLVNAGDALEEAGVPHGEVRVRGEVQGPQVVLLVEDNGPGFPSEVLPRLFEAFFTTKGPEKGTGLGLSISRELVERFGGTLHAENRPEGGARLRIALPIHVPKPPEGGQG
jgi:signal transduction histidine kinase